MKITEKKPELRNIDSLIPYELNAKKHDKAQVKRLATSIKRFGWRGNPIIVDKFGVIIAGHGRRLAAIELGLTQVPVVVEEDMSAEEARAFRLADNRAADGDIDSNILQEELLDLGNFASELLGDIFDKKELDFAVADLMVMNEDTFTSDLDTVMDEQSATTAGKIDAAGEKRVPIARAFGFKDVQGDNLIYINRFMAQLEAETGKAGEGALVEFIKSLVGELSHG